MSLTTTLISRFTAVDIELARRAWNVIDAMDDPDETPPREFLQGGAARCYALTGIVYRSPARFWGFFLAVLAIPLLSLWHWVA
jgi:hypothetical protein